MSFRSTIVERARQLRKTPTEGESILWNELKGKKMGPRIRRQHPLGKYIFDFYCHEAKLVIELDGDYQSNRVQKELDAKRDEEIISWNLKVIRFSESDVKNNLSLVLERIRKEIDKEEAF